MRPSRLLVLVLAVALPVSLAAVEPGPDPLPSEASGAPTGPTHYVQVSDGEWIALHVQMPASYVEGERYPTIVEASGYESGSADGNTAFGDLRDLTGVPFPLTGGTRAAHGAFHDEDYVTVMASIRGTGCSSGEFDLFSYRSALDLREIIDGWIAHQPWSDRMIGIYGHSYSGITGTMVAATQPAELDAISVSGLIGDLYRDIVYPGGVTNYGFPLLWTGAVRPVYDLGGGTVGGLYPTPQERCATNQAERSRVVLDDPLLQGLDDTDSEWYRTRSLYSMVDRIEVPTHITTAYQDEQTGPRGATTVWTHLPDDIAKRIVMTNGDHGTQDDWNIRGDGLAWLDYWLRGLDHPEPADAVAFPGGEQAALPAIFGPRARPTTTSRVFLGYRDAEHREDGLHDGVISDGAGFPLAGTRWTDLYASADSTLVDRPEDVTAGELTWLHGSRRQAYSYQAGADNGGELSSPTGPDEVELTYAFEADTVIAGPITATLDIASTAVDTELFVQLIDRAPTGEMLYLQRGMLRASHRAIQPDLSLYTDDGRLWRPWRPHQNTELVTPGEVVTYLVEIFPVGHVFPAGHELVVKVHAPPLDDNDYVYVPKTAPAVNRLVTSPERPSSLMLPVIDLDRVEHYDPVGVPCAYEQMRCTAP